MLTWIGPKQIRSIRKANNREFCETWHPDKKDHIECQTPVECADTEKGKAQFPANLKAGFIEPFP